MPAITRDTSVTPQRRLSKEYLTREATVPNLWSLHERLELLENIDNYTIRIGTETELADGLATHLIDTFAAAVVNDSSILFLNGTHTPVGDITLTETGLTFNCEAGATLDLSATGIDFSSSGTGCFGKLIFTNPPASIVTLSGAGSHYTVLGIDLSDIVTADGVTIIDSSTTGGMLLSSRGTISNPALGFSVDPNTGIYSSGIDTLNFTTNGIERIKLTTSNFELYSNLLISGAITRPSGNLVITATSGNVLVDSVTFNAGAVSTVTTLDTTDDITITKSENGAVVNSIVNVNTGISAVGRFEVQNNTGFLDIELYGSGNTGTIMGVTAGEYGIIRTVTAGNGLIVGTQNSAPLIFGTGGAERMRIESDGVVGIGTPTIPYLGEGTARLAIHGTDLSVNGPHVQFTTSADQYPLFQITPIAHDSISLVFDAYWDGVWKSSDADSNFNIQKNVDLLSFEYDSGVAVGTALGWNTGFTMNTSGVISMSGSLLIDTIDEASTDAGVTIEGVLLENNDITMDNVSGGAVIYLGKTSTNDFRIYNNATTTGYIVFENNLLIQRISTNKIGIGAEVTLYDSAGTAVLATTTNGVDIPGTLTVNTINEYTLNAGVTIEGVKHENNNLTIFDGGLISIGSGQDAYLSSDGTDFSITLLADTADFRLFGGTTSSDNMITALSNGGIFLYYDNSLKLSTVTGGVSMPGSLVVDTINEFTGDAGVTIEGVLFENNAIYLEDSEYIYFGAGSDSNIHHTTDITYFDNLSTTTMYIRGGTTGTNNLAQFNTSGSVALFYNGGSSALVTTSGGVNITGTLDISTALQVDTINDSGGGRVTVNGLVMGEDFIRNIITTNTNPSNTTIADTENVLIHYRSGTTRQILLPTAVDGKEVIIKQASATNDQTVTIATPGSETIEGSTDDWVLYDANESVTLIAEGTTKWHIINTTITAVGPTQCNVFCDGTSTSSWTEISAAPVYTSGTWPSGNFTKFVTQLPDTDINIDAYGTGKRGQFIWLIDGQEIPRDQYDEIEETSTISVEIYGDWTALNLQFEGRKR